MNTYFKPLLSIWHTICTGVHPLTDRSASLCFCKCTNQKIKRVEESSANITQNKKEGFLPVFAFFKQMINIWYTALKKFSSCWIKTLLTDNNRPWRLWWFIFNILGLLKLNGFIHFFFYLPLITVGRRLRRILKKWNSPEGEEPISVQKILNLGQRKDYSTTQHCLTFNCHGKRKYSYCFI